MASSSSPSVRVPLHERPALEKAVRLRGGMPTYEGHFIQQYIFEPLTPYGPTAFHLFCFSKVAVAYGLFFWRRRRRLSG